VEKKRRKKRHRFRLRRVTAETAVAVRPVVETTVAPRRRRQTLPLLNLVGALIVSAAVLYVTFFPAPGLPALGPAFNPTTGAWTMAAEAQSMHQLDAMFTLLGYQPQPWSPIDSLLVKGDMTQTLNFTDTPLVMALLKKSLGADLSSEWFPILPPNQQSPYDIGPYAKP